MSGSGAEINQTVQGRETCSQWKSLAREGHGRLETQGWRKLEGEKTTVCRGGLQRRWDLQGVGRVQELRLSPWSRGQPLLDSGQVNSLGVQCNMPWEQQQGQTMT